MKVSAVEFVSSAAGAVGLPRDGRPEVALVGRSNVGKSSLINALVRRAVARTSAAPGKTRLINVYRVRLSGPAGGPGPPWYLVDLPGYGYARGGPPAAQTFAALAREYFLGRDGRSAEAGPEAAGRRSAVAGAILAVDLRHPGLPPDVAAHAWLAASGVPTVVAGTKADKLSKGARARAVAELEHSLKGPVLPVSAETGEGLEALWKQIVRLTSRPKTERTAP